MASLHDALDLLARGHLVGSLDARQTGSLGVAQRYVLLEGIELLLLACVTDPEVFAAVFAEVDGDPVDPGRELRLAPERADRLEYLHEDLLGEVLGLRAVADHPEDQREDPSLVSADERRERPLVAGDESLDESGVGIVGQHPTPCCLIPAERRKEFPRARRGATCGPRRRCVCDAIP